MVICCHAKAVFATLGGDFPSFSHFIWWVTVFPNAFIRRRNDDFTTLGDAVTITNTAMPHMNCNSMSLMLLCALVWCGSMQELSFVCSETQHRYLMRLDSGYSRPLEINCDNCVDIEFSVIFKHRYAQKADIQIYLWWYFNSTTRAGVMLFPLRRMLRHLLTMTHFYNICTLFIKYWTWCHLGLVAVVWTNLIIWFHWFVRWDVIILPQLN